MKPDLLANVHESWLPILEPHSSLLAEIEKRVLDLEGSSHQIAPPTHLILRALEVPLDSVRVLVVGQDPYPTEDHAVGWSFSVAPTTVPIPKSLVNIFKELESDIGCPISHSGDLSGWVHQGVLLLNRSLTVEVGSSGSHRDWGWHTITNALVRGLAGRGLPLVSLLWGADAQSVRGMLGDLPTIESAHPSPLSAYRGFWGSRPFSRANELLQSQGAEPVNWCLTSR